MSDRIRYDPDTNTWYADGQPATDPSLVDETAEFVENVTGGVVGGDGWVADLLRGLMTIGATLILALLGVVLLAAGVLGVFGLGPGDLLKGPAGVAVKVAGGS